MSETKDVRVKALEWHARSDIPGLHNALGADGWWRNIVENRAGQFEYEGAPADGKLQIYSTLAAAKAAAQADYEQRIRSALTSPEAPQASEVVRELMEALEPLAGLMDDETLKSWPKHRDRFPATTYSSNSIRIGDIRRAHSALAKIGGDHDK